jgi:large subunit ribosomal protein L24
MSAKAKVCKNDLVVVLTGKDVGKQGRVISVKPRDGKVLVEGVAEIKKHVRRNPQRGETGGIVEKEAFIDISNVQVVCPSCGKPTRVSMKVNEDGTKNRFCKKCNSVIERS